MPIITDRTVAVLDPVSPGGRYGAEIRAMGLTPIAVWTHDFTGAYQVQTFEPEHYAAVYRHRDVADTVDFLRKHDVAALVPAAQTSLAVIDELADRLGLIGNPAPSLLARSDKGVMKEHWSAHGVPCADWLASGDLREVRAWAERRGFPVVLKPPASGGASHVFICTDAREVETAFRVITREPDVYDRSYPTVLAEEYLDGDEFFMNLLHDGTGPAELVSVARYEKLQRDGHASIYRTFRSMPLDDPAAQAALPVIRRANEAVGVRYGINDTEYKLTSRGLRVIEINNRLPGAGTPDMIERCSGLNCFRRTVEILLGEYTRPPGGYGFDRHYVVCCLINDRAGRVTGYRGLTDVRRLPSFHGSRLIAQPGEHWPVTEDLNTTWGLVSLVHDDPAQLDRDAEAVHGLLRLEVE